MYGTPYIFHFVHPLVKTAEIMVQRVNFERNLENIRLPTVCASNTLPYDNKVDIANTSMAGLPLDGQAMDKLPR